MAIFLCLGCGGLWLYGQRAVGAALGWTSREAYLAKAAPDFAKVRFVNMVLHGKEAEGKTLVFFRHVYHLEVPFVYGHPDASWAMNPDKLRDQVSWRELFVRERIRWVVKAPGYPEAIARPLEQLEKQGILTPVAQSEVEDFRGNRIFGVRQKMAVTILEVHGDSTARR